MKYKYWITRSYRSGYTHTTTSINGMLEMGWEVYICTPYMKDGTTEQIEYVLRKEID